MSTCPVVRIKSDEHAIYGGFVEINESDFDEKVHKLYEEPTSDDQIAVEHKKRGRPAKD